MRLEISNNWGYVLDYVCLPSELVFVENDIQEVLLPVPPGVVLEPAFFEQNRTYELRYPGFGGFADYIALSSTKGQISIYSLFSHDDLIRPVQLGFAHNDLTDPPDSTYYIHKFGARVDNGGTWASPVVRIRISQSPLETINAYREDNGLDQFPSLSEKLGVHYAQVVASPLYKADAYWLYKRDNLRFSDYTGKVFADLPSPGILHPVAFQKGGFDENQPDILPPASELGTLDDFEDMFQQAQAHGFLVMPYINPTWWDDESPTLQNLPEPLTITDTAVLDKHSVPVYETYYSRGGYVVSPYVPFVQQRLDQLITQMTTDVPSNMIFEDQVGARSWLFDHNQASISPTSYADGWLDHTRIYSDALLMTEGGFDRLCETEVGFHGSVLLWEKHQDELPWGNDTWHLYPLAPLMVRDKVLFYQHDLDVFTMTVTKANLTWNLASGYMLSYDLFHGIYDSWVNVVSDFQEHVLAGFADELMVDFTYLEDLVTQTEFESFTVVANWDDSNPYAIGEYTLPPSGVLVTNADASLVAGIFAEYNGVSLSPGDHYLIEERGETAIIVRQPLGADTDLTIDLLPDWTQDDSIESWAYAANEQAIGNVSTTVVAQHVTFEYQQSIDGQAVAYYKVCKPDNIYLPLVLRH